MPFGLPAGDGEKNVDFREDSLLWTGKRIHARSLRHPLLVRPPQHLLPTSRLRISLQTRSQPLRAAPSSNPHHEFAVALRQYTHLIICVESVEKGPRVLSLRFLVLDVSHTGPNHD